MRAEEWEADAARQRVAPGAPGYRGETTAPKCIKEEGKPTYGWVVEHAAAGSGPIAARSPVRPAMRRRLRGRCLCLLPMRGLVELHP